MKTKLRRVGVALALGLTALLAPLAAPSGAAGPAEAVEGPDEVRLNEIQTVGSHNSYHEEASPEESNIRQAFIGSANDLMMYTHAPLGEQFADQNVRQIELDIFRDDDGGKYAEPLLRSVAGHDPLPEDMAEPGTKVLHVQDVDYRSTCLSLVACLEAVETWSDANPDHVPLAILLELKDGTIPDIGGFSFTVPDPWDTASMDALDDEIRSVVDPEDMITPDDVRGDAATLEEAVLSDGWPTLGESRGKVMFLMDNGGGYRTDYLAGHPSLAGRVMFTNASPGAADAAFVKVNDSRSNVAHIQGLVADGYVVRTRADAETVEAREGDFTGRDAALESGAQWVSTDYPVPEIAEDFGTGYYVAIPGGTVARCNPINGPDGCESASLEEPPEVPGEADYVDRLSRMFLGRPASAADIEYWVGRMEAGTPRTSVASGMAHSAEGRRGPVLDAVYLTYLDRAADAAARDYWVDQQARGMVLDRVEVAVLASPEVHSRAGSNAAWVDDVFRRVLGRSADPAGLAHFTAALDSGATRSTVARGVLSSVEGRRVRAAASSRAVLSRNPSPTESVQWSALLHDARDTRTLLIWLVATDEFHDA